MNGVLDLRQRCLLWRTMWSNSFFVENISNADSLLVSKTGKKTLVAGFEHWKGPMNAHKKRSALKHCYGSDRS